MSRELTITIDEDVYEDLHRIMDKTEISGFIETLVRSHVPSAANHERSVADLLAMPEAADIPFDPPRLDTELYRKSETL